MVSVKDGSSKFEVYCKAHEAGELCVGARSVSIAVGQLLRVAGTEQMWHSLAVFAREDEDGSLVIRVLVCNPDWEEPLQIASIKSRPTDIDCQTALGCNLDHITP